MAVPAALLAAAQAAQGQPGGCGRRRLIQCQRLAGPAPGSDLGPGCAATRAWRLCTVLPPAAPPEPTLPLPAVVIYYGAAPASIRCPQCTAVYFAAGPKWRLLHRLTLLPAWRQRYARRYRAVMFPDDDLQASSTAPGSARWTYPLPGAAQPTNSEPSTPPARRCAAAPLQMDTHTINTVFRLMARHGVLLAQARRIGTAPACPLCAAPDAVLRPHTHAPQPSICHGEPEVTYTVQEPLYQNTSDALHFTSAAAARLACLGVLPLVGRRCAPARPDASGRHPGDAQQWLRSWRRRSRWGRLRGW